MRVICNTLDDFIENLGGYEKDDILQGCVYVDTTKNPVDGNKRTAVKFSVVFQASAVIALPDGGEFLLQMGVDCGTDYHDGTQAMDGTEEADNLRFRLKDFCSSRGVLVRPGIIDV